MIMHHSNREQTLGDHCCIATSIATNFTVTAQVDNIQTQSCPERFLWKSPYKEKFYDQVNSRETKTIFEKLCKVDFDNNQCGIDNDVTSLTTPLIQVAKSLPILKFRKRKKSNSIKKKWYDKSCDDMKHGLTRLAKIVKHNPLNCIVRQKFNVVEKVHKTELSLAFSKDPESF